MQLLTIKELMSFLKVKRNTVYELRRKGLPVIHLGRSIRFERDEVIKWVRTNCCGGNQPQTTGSRLEENSPMTPSMALVAQPNQIASEYLL